METSSRKGTRKDVRHCESLQTIFAHRVLNQRPVECWTRPEHIVIPTEEEMKDSAASLCGTMDLLAEQRAAAEAVEPEEMEVEKEGERGRKREHSIEAEGGSEQKRVRVDGEEGEEETPAPPQTNGQ